MRSSTELLDIETEAEAIAKDFDIALDNGHIFEMRICFRRLVRNHEKVVHVLMELCETVTA